MSCLIQIAVRLTFFKTLENQGEISNNYPIFRTARILSLNYFDCLFFLFLLNFYWKYGTVSFGYFLIVWNKNFELTHGDLSTEFWTIWGKMLDLDLQLNGFSQKFLYIDFCVLGLSKSKIVSSLFGLLTVLYLLALEES